MRIPACNRHHRASRSPPERAKKRGRLMEQVPVQAVENQVTAKDSDARQHFRTDHLMADLRGRSVRGGAVTMGAQGIKFALQLGSTAVLARLLSPADFGLVAMVTAVTGFAAMFKDAGLSMATVQRENVTHDQVSTLFWINVALSAVLMCLVALLAPAIAWFYGEPRLTAITLALAGTFIFGGLTVQHQALLQRQMRFTSLSAIGVISFAASVAAAIVAAIYGLGYWSIVIMTATAAAVNAALVWVYSGWRPGLPVRGSGVMPMLKFGGNVTGFNLLNYFARNSDNILIGWWWGGAALGLYSKAYGLLMMPLTQINAPISSVILPMLSRLQSQPERYRSAYLRVVRALSFALMPPIAFLIVTADWVVLIVLGPQWTEAASVYRFLAVVALAQPVSFTCGWLFTSQGRVREQFHWGIWGCVTTVLAIVVGLPFGIDGVAFSYGVSGLLLRTPLLYYCVGRKGHVSTKDIYVATAPPFFVAIGLLVSLSLLRLQFPDLNALWGLGIAALLTATVTIPLAIRNFRMNEFSLKQ